jgi:hypothetical protein
MKREEKIREWKWDAFSRMKWPIAPGTLSAVFFNV